MNYGDDRACAGSTHSSMPVFQGIAGRFSHVQAASPRGALCAPLKKTVEKVLTAKEP